MNVLSYALQDFGLSHRQYKNMNLDELQTIINVKLDNVSNEDKFQYLISRNILLEAKNNNNVRHVSFSRFKEMF